MRLERLYPEAAMLTVAEAAGALDLAGRAPPDRPYLVLNMVGTADGKATLSGRTAAISSEADRELFHQLRAQADAVLVGAGTVRTERYGPLVKTDALRAQRVRAGLAVDQLAVIVSGTLNLPGDLPLLQDPGSRVLIYTEAVGELEGAAAQIEYVRHPPEAGALTLEPLLRALRERGVRSVLCEGGPTLNASLLREGLVDELFLTLAPTLVGSGERHTIVDGEPLDRPLGLELLSAHLAEGHLFLRYHVRG